MKKKLFFTAAIFFVMEIGVNAQSKAWAENCEFIAHSGTAAIWHDGSRYEDSKTVLINCKLKGYDGFLLGRYHRDAQFSWLTVSLPRI